MLTLMSPSVTYCLRILLFIILYIYYYFIIFIIQNVRNVKDCEFGCLLLYHIACNSCTDLAGNWNKESV